MPTTAANRSSLTPIAAQSEKILATFDHYIIMDDVEVKDVTDEISAVGIGGSRGREVLIAAGFCGSRDPASAAAIRYLARYRVFAGLR